MAKEVSIGLLKVGHPTGEAELGTAHAGVPTRDEFDPWSAFHLTSVSDVVYLRCKQVTDLEQDMTETQQIANTIRSQIKAADFWCLAACGARDYIALDANEDRRGGLMFRVTITSPRTHHKIIIELTHLDEYKVQRVKIKRVTYEVIIEEETTCYCDNLAAVVYGFCNK